MSPGFREIAETFGLLYRLGKRFGQKPVARQLRHGFLRYMASTQFKPTVDLTAEQVRSLIQPKTTEQATDKRG